MTNLALEAVLTVRQVVHGKTEIDIKRYARIEKIPGGDIEDSRVLRGVMVNKDVVVSGMRRRIENPRIILLDASLEYKKAESQTNVEITKEEDFVRLLEIEEENIKRLCDDIIKLKPDVVCVEKGVSDLASHFLSKAGVSVFRRLRKTDNNRIARACGATIQNRTDELKESDVGLGCGLFEVRKIGDEYFAFFEECKNPKACTIMLRGATKDVLNEVERNLQDAMNIARNVVNDARLLPGGGATEMALAHAIQEKSKTVEGPHQIAFQAIGMALEVIPRTLAQNCGAHTVRVITELRSKHAAGKTTFGIDGDKGTIVDMNQLGIWEPVVVKYQTLKTSIECSSMLLRIDDIVSGMTKKKKEIQGAPPQKFHDDSDSEPEPAPGGGR
jgi:T-complex protein 1 subunit gamma